MSQRHTFPPCLPVEEACGPASVYTEWLSETQWVLQRGGAGVQEAWDMSDTAIPSLEQLGRLEAAAVVGPVARADEGDMVVDGKQKEAGAGSL